MHSQQPETTPALNEPPRQWLIRLALPCLVWAGLLSVGLLLVDFHMGIDVYFHTKLSEIMRDDGLVLKTFPWVTESIWADAWFDKEWLFHVALIPFLSLGREIGPKIYTFALNFVMILSFAYLLYAGGVRTRGIRFWLTLLPFMSTGLFVIRMSTCRPHLLSLIVLTLALGAMFRRKAILLGILSGLYAVSYTGYWQLLGLVLIYDIAYLVLDDNGHVRNVINKRLPMLVPALLGMVAGTLLHPNFPSSVYGLYVQNVLVLKDAWTQEAVQYSARPEELRGTYFEVFRLCAPVFAFVIAGVVVIRNRRLVLSRSLLIFATYFCGYFAMFFLSVRFIEYFQPFAVFFLAVFFQKNPLPYLFKGIRSRQIVVCAMILFSIGYCWKGFSKGSGLGYYWSMYVARANLLQDGKHRYTDAAGWFKQNLQPGEIIFSTQWDDNSVLWFHAPEYRYPVLLDPKFMMQRDHERYEEFNLILSGKHPTPVKAIKETFKSRVVFLSPDENDFAMQLERLGFKYQFEGKTKERIYLLDSQPVQDRVESPVAP